MGTKNGRIYGKEAPFKGAPQAVGGAVAPNCPLDPPLKRTHQLTTGKHRQNC